jgi:enterochelin esterase family protein
MRSELARWAWPVIVAVGFFSFGPREVLAQPPPVAGTPLEPTVRADLSPGGVVTYTVDATAGDLVSGPLDIERGGPLLFEVFDPRQEKLEAEELGSGVTMTRGFVATLTGTYRVRLSAPATVSASFTWATSVASPAERMRGHLGTPVVTYQSPRIVRLANDLAAGVSDAAAKFWEEATRNGGPIVEPLPLAGGRGGEPGPAGGAGQGGAAIDQDVLVTFLWREIYETFSVEVVRPPWGPKDYRLMTRLPGTDVWYKTMRVHRTSRFMYWLAPNRRDEDDGVVDLIDPLNPRRFPASEDQWVAKRPIDSDPAAAWGSVLSLSGAPDESWVRTVPPRRGDLVERQFQAPSLGATLRLHIYTPPEYEASSGPYPLVVLFDGPAYATGPAAAPTTLDNLVAAGRIQPPVVCFVSSSTSAGNRAANLGFNPAFNAAIATELVPWLRSSFALSARPVDVVVGGWSAGGRAATDIALDYPEVFGNVLSQSGAFRGGQLQARYIAADRMPIRFYLDVGLYDNVPWASRPLDEAALDQGLTLANRHMRDILLAKGYDVTYLETGGDHGSLRWRATLADGLMTLLAPGGR